MSFKGDVSNSFAVLHQVVSCKEAYKIRVKL